MRSAIQHTARVHFRHAAHGQKQVHAGEPPTTPVGRVPRVARLLALAHRFERLIQTGVAADYADLARLGHVTRARVTQIMNLLVLAPEIQEQILCWSPVTRGKDPISERGLRQLVTKLAWKRQRELWILVVSKAL